MRRERTRRLLVIAGCLILAFSTGAQGVSPQEGSGARDLDRAGPGDGRVRPDPVPPIGPDPQLEPEAFVSNEVQLLGFTLETYPANRGVLNYSMACKAEFGLSRMCTMEEVNRTLNIPLQPGQGLAWVNFTGDLDAAARMLALDSSGLNKMIRPLNLNNCRGWTTTSPDHGALAVDLGEFDCYGGWMTVPCDRKLSVSCCGPVSGP